MHDRFSCLVALHACIFAAVFIDGSVIVHDIDFRQIMTLAHLKVIGVMGRCDLYSAGSEFFIYIGIRHDRDFFAHQRQDCFLSYDVFVALIIRMYGDGCIAQHGLRTGGCDLQEIIGSHDRILDMPEMSVLFLMLNFRVGKGCLTYRTPVDDPGALIDIAFLIQADKYFFYRFGASLVHGEPFSVPVTGYAQLL